MQRIERILWIVIISIMVYFLVPIIGFAMSDIFASIYAKVCVLLINVIYVILVNIFIIKKDSFRWYYPVIIGILFIPASILIYDISTIYFSILYIIIGIICSLIYHKKQVL